MSASIQLFHPNAIQGHLPHLLRFVQHGDGPLAQFDDYIEDCSGWVAESPAAL